MAPIGKAPLRAAAATSWRTHLAPCRVASSSFATTSAHRLPPAPPAVSSNASMIMADEAQLGRHFYLNRALEHWASRSTTKMTLRGLLFFGKSLGRDPEKIIKSANYVREELPIRIAKRIRDMQDLPFVVMTNEHLEKVYQLYWSAFDRFRRWPVITTHEDNAKFIALLKELLNSHLTVIPSLALGVVEVSEHLPPGQLEGFMLRMLRSRISRRVLAEQHIALSEALDDPFAFFSPEPSLGEPALPETIGIIRTHLSVRGIIRESISLLQTVFAREAGLSVEEAIRTKAVPDVVVDGDLEARVSYIPEHLSFVVFELVKDAMLAVMRFKPEERDEIPLRVTIVEGPPEDDMIIRISDCGGGVSDLVSRLAAAAPTGAAAAARASHRAASSAVPTMPATTVGKGEGAVASSSTTASPLSSPPSSSGQDPSSDTSPPTLDQTPHHWPAGAISPVRSSGVSSNLTDVLCSFSNVKQRLELEEEARREKGKIEQVLRGERGGMNEGPNAATSQASLAEEGQEEEDSDVQSSGSTSSTLLGASAQAGLGSRSKLELLRRTGKFKGTVREQVGSAGSADQTDSTIPSPSPSVDPPPRPQPARTNEQHHYLQSSLSETSLGLADTGLGMAMARVYAEYFGGSLNFRSLDGHGMDVYYRVAKLGTNQEGVKN